ncbi:MAG: hypothetical protein JWR21_2551 [Herminiimonas sp.]|jgi:hypothetical protein|nr:hypothetical protein [Herminiimonas sp.]MDB5852459.1 hypothetical protein [Herminiimonas sp.]
MLTATYSLVTLSVEQKNARCGLSALQQFISNNARSAAQPDVVVLETAINKLSEFDEYCHSRKVEMYVIPAIRKATREADPLLAELESLSHRGLCILGSLRVGVRSAVGQGREKIEELCASMELYCANLYQRLVKEEELFNIAQRVISMDQWFSIAADFLSDDAARKPHHGASGKLLPG